MKYRIPISHHHTHPEIPCDTMKTLFHLIFPNIKKYILHGIIIVPIVIAYANIFQNSLVWDDYDLIVNWPEIRSWENIPKFLMEATNPNYPDTYRPIRYIFSIFMYQISGTNPTGYHIATLLLHIAATLLIYSIIRTLTKDTKIPFITALLFGVHPIHTEAITWISSGMDMIGVVFMLSSITLVLQPQIRHRLWLSIIFAVLAYFTLEITVVLPFLLALVIRIKNRHHTQTIKYSTIFPYVLLAMLYLFIRWRAIGIQEVFGHIDGRADRTFFLMMHAVVVYIQTLIAPIHLTINHMLHTGIPSFMIEIGDAFPTTLTFVRSITIADPHVLLGISIITGSMCGFVFYWSRAPLVSFALGWMMITFLPVMNIIPGHTLMAERYAYLPSVGFCLIVAIISTKLLTITKNHKTHMLVIGMLVCLILSYTVRTIQRNRDWKNGITLWETATDQNHYSYIAFTALGKQYVAANEFEKAINAYKHVLHFFPEQKMVIGYLTELYIHERRYTDAIDLIRSVILLRPQEAEIWIKLGDVYRLIPDPENASAAYKTAQKLDPDNSMVRTRLSQ